MIGICLGLAGVIAAQLPVSEFTLAWQHSVEKLRWEEDYRIQGRQLYLVEARLQGSGAGMEIPPQARFEGGQWRYQPDILLKVLTLGRTPEAGDYQVCLAGEGCQAMARWLGPPDGARPAVEVWACEVG